MERVASSTTYSTKDLTLQALAVIMDLPLSQLKGHPMANKTKDESKKAPKKPINIKSTIKKYLAKPLAYMVLILAASYGIKTALKTLDESVATALTVLLVLALCYILFDD